MISENKVYIILIHVNKMHDTGWIEMPLTIDSTLCRLCIAIDASAKIARAHLEILMFQGSHKNVSCYLRILFSLCICNHFISVYAISSVVIKISATLECSSLRENQSVKYSHNSPLLYISINMPVFHSNRLKYETHD